MLNLSRWVRNYRAGSRGFAELVPWMLLVADDVVMCKDGSLLAMFQFSGVHLEACAPGEDERIVASLEHALRAFDERCALWWIVDRRRAPATVAGGFPDPVSSRIEQLWCAELERQAPHVNRHFLAIAMAPAAAAAAWVDGFVQSVRRTPAEAVRRAFDRRHAFAIEAARIDRDHARLSGAIEAFAETVPLLGLRRLSGSALLSALHDRASPASEGQAVEMPSPPCYLDAWLPDNQLDVGRDSLCFSHLDAEPVRMAALAIKGWPGATWPGMLDELLSVPGEITAVSALRLEHPQRAARRIRDAERHQRNLRKGAMAYLREAITREESAQVDAGRVRLAEEAAEALATLTAEGATFGHACLTVLVRATDADTLAQTLRECGTRLRRRGFLLLRERANLLGAFSVSLPGQWALTPRWHLVSGANACDLAPLRSEAAGPAGNAHLSRQLGSPQPVLTHLPAADGTRIAFDLHVEDVGHALLLGPSGSGKSVLLNFLLAQARRYPGVRVCLFDRDYAARVPTLLQGGSHVDFGREAGSPRLNPLARLDDARERAWVAQWVAMLLGDEARSPLALRALTASIDLLAAQPRELWRLRALAALLPPTLGAALSPWVGEGGFARYFDHPEDTLDFGALACIELGALFREPIVAAAVLEYAFHRLDRSLDGSPAFVCVDEAWSVLGDSRFAARLGDWLRTLRKRNASVILATQSLAEIDGSPVLPVILDNVPTRIHLANPHVHAQRRLYVERLGLTEAQLARIRDLRPCGEAYVMQPGRAWRVQCRFPPAVLAALRSDPAAQRLFLGVQAQGGADWIERYLAQAGGEDAGARVPA